MQLPSALLHRHLAFKAFGCFHMDPLSTMQDSDPNLVLNAFDKLAAVAVNVSLK